MKIRLAEFKEGVPMPVTGALDPKKLDLEFPDLKYAKPLALSGTVEKGPETVTFRGHLTSEIEHTCGRCVKIVKELLDEPFEFFYEIKGREILETVDDLREILILNHPLVFLCRKDCRGLCPQCGTNLNESQCACAGDSSSRGLQNLGKIRLQRKKENPRG